MPGPSNGRGGGRIVCGAGRLHRPHGHDHQLPGQLRRRPGDARYNRNRLPPGQGPRLLEVLRPHCTTVKAEPITDDDGLGCQVTISGVKVPQASQAEPNTIVVRDGDVYKVTIQPFPSDPSQDANGAGGAEGGAPEASAAPSGGPGAPQPSSTSFKGIVDTRVSVTFPGAVTQSGGGKVSGTTVTWNDPDTVAKGVSASGYARDGQGVSWWSRYRVWLTAGLILLGGGLTVAVLRRRSTGHAPRKQRKGDPEPSE